MICPCAFAVPAVGFLGNLARNTIVRQGLGSWGLSITKNFRLTPISEGAILYSRAELFNIVNRAKFTDTGRNIYNFSFQTLSSAGVISDTAPPGQSQLGVKMSWSFSITSVEGGDLSAPFVYDECPNGTLWKVPV